MRDSHRKLGKSMPQTFTGKSIPKQRRPGYRSDFFICSARKLVTEDDVSPILNIFCCDVFLFVQAAATSLILATSIQRGCMGGMNPGPFLEICLYTA